MFSQESKIQGKKKSVSLLEIGGARLPTGATTGARQSGRKELRQKPEVAGFPAGRHLAVRQQLPQREPVPRDVVDRGGLLGTRPRPGDGASQHRGPFAAALLALRFQRRVTTREPRLSFVPAEVCWGSRPNPRWPASRRPPSPCVAGGSFALKCFALEAGHLCMACSLLQ